MHERKRLIVTRQDNLLCTRPPAPAKVLSYGAMPYACAAMLITEGNFERPAEPAAETPLGPAPHRLRQPHGQRREEDARTRRAAMHRPGSGRNSEHAAE